MITKVDRNKNRKKRHLRSRRNTIGTADHPRLNVFRSAKHMYAQLIDDQQGQTIAAASTLEKEFEGQATSNKEAAKKVGELIAKRATEKGYSTVVFDRGGNRFHGRVKELAEAAREAGLKF